MPPRRDAGIHLVKPGATGRARSLAQGAGGGRRLDCTQPMGDLLHGRMKQGMEAEAPFKLQVLRFFLRCHLQTKLGRSFSIQL